MKRKKGKREIFCVNSLQFDKNRRKDPKRKKKAKKCKKKKQKHPEGRKAKADTAPL